MDNKLIRSTEGFVITRFAPAPTGFLHLGHVVNALHVWKAAHDRDGQVLLRIEDHDRQRSRPAYEAAILEDLAWLGFRHDGAVVRQSERDAVYRKAIQPLIDRELVYGCACSRAEILAATGDQPAPELRYPNTCRDRDIALTDGVGWRLRIEPGTEAFFDEFRGPQVQDPSAQCGDLLLRDRLGNWTYQFAVTVDDHLQNVTDVIRGMDLLPSTGRQMRLARLLGRITMPRFAHHGLVMKSAAEKLSKSDGDSGVRDLRAAGWSAEAVLNLARRSVTLPPMKRIVLAVLVLALLAPAAALAHPGHEHKLMGTITAIDGNKVAMKTTEGKDTTFAVVPTTSFKRGKGKGAQSDLKVGLRVVVNVGDGAEPLKAKEVQYAAPTTTAKQ